MSKKVLITILMLIALFAMGIAQTGVIKGTVKANDTDEPLIGANVLVEGTFLGSATDEDGYFEITGAPMGSIRINVSFLGYSSQTVEVQLTADQLTTDLDVKMEPTMYKTQEIIVEASRAKDRETPVAFTNITKEQISKNFTIQDVPHLFKNTAGVYVTTDGGSGMGDSKTYIRGFDEQRISVMINGIEVNDPESKKVYWSNWGSLPSGSQSIQVQRGAGSTLYGAGAFGGSINVVTQDAVGDRSYGFMSTVAGYGTYKLGGEFNSGLMGEKYSFTGKAIYLEGNGWRKNTFYRGLQYYFTFNYFMSEEHTVRAIFHGAPQYHAYSYFSNSAKDLARYGRDYNSNPWVRSSDSGLTDRETNGTKLMDIMFLSHIDKDKGGEVIGNSITSFDNNVYHKPQFEVHHTWDMNKNTYLQTSFFGTMGRGYGENIGSGYKIAKDKDGEMSIAGIDAANVYQYRAHSIHNQAGFVSTYNTKYKNHEFSAGAEARFWKARHYGLVTNTFGQETIGYFIGGEYTGFRQGDVYYDQTTVKPNYSVFGHALWKFGDFSFMTDLQYSLRKYDIKEDMPGSKNLPDPNGNYVFTQNVDGGNNDGYVNNADTTYSLVDFDKSYDFLSPKLGVNYNINKNLNVFANFSRVYNEPRVKYFYNFGYPIDDFDIEVSTDYELGFGYLASNFSSKINVYQIDFENKAFELMDRTKANQPGYDYKGRKYIPVGSARYRGIEITAAAKITPNFELGSAVTIAKNAWTDDITDLAKSDLGIEEGMIEPEYPQQIFTGTFQYNKNNWFISGAIRHFRDYYILPGNGYIDLEYDVDLGKATKSGATLPNWTVSDIIIGYQERLGGANLNISLHINNIFDQEYYQIGNKYGLVPGPERNIMLNMAVGL